MFYIFDILSGNAAQVLLLCSGCTAFPLQGARFSCVYLSRLLPRVTSLPVRAALGARGRRSTSHYPFSFSGCFVCVPFHTWFSIALISVGIGQLLPAVIRAGLDLCVLRSMVFDVVFFAFTHVYVKCRNCVSSSVCLHDYSRA